MLLGIRNPAKVKKIAAMAATLKQSNPARRLLALLAPLSSEDEKTKRALASLRGWDARLHSDSPQAALEATWELRHLRKGVREAVLKPEAAAALAATDMNVMLAGLETPETRLRRAGDL
jgi:penicillin amidase